jgi:hypothetical protein
MNAEGSAGGRRAGSVPAPHRLCGRADGGLVVLGCVTLLGSAGSQDEGAGGECIGGEGAVAGEPDDPCIAEDGSEITRVIGMCATGGEAAEEAGRWVIRFDYFANCSDLPEDSPHGHAAFYIDVP